MLRFQGLRSQGWFDRTALSIVLLLICACAAEASEPGSARSENSLPQSTDSAKENDAESGQQRAPAAVRPSLSKESEDALRGAVSRVNQMMESASQSTDSVVETSSPAAAE